MVIEGGIVMDSIYGDISDLMIIKNTDDLINQIFKLLPYKENDDERLEGHFEATLFRIVGMSKVFESYPEWLTIICILESARNEKSFYLYRKAILDSCAMVRNIQNKVGGNNA